MRVEDWEVMVGRLILTFGEIELRLLQLYWNISIDGAYDPGCKEWGLSKKLDQISKAIRTSSMERDHARRLSEAIRECRDLSKVRNLVAHNPLSMDEFLTATQPGQAKSLIASLRQTGERVDEDELRDAVTKSQHVSERLLDLSGSSQTWRWRIE